MSKKNGRYNSNKLHTVTLPNGEFVDAWVYKLKEPEYRPFKMAMTRNYTKGGYSGTAIGIVLGDGRMYIGVSFISPSEYQIVVGKNGREHVKSSVVRGKSELLAIGRAKKALMVRTNHPDVTIGVADDKQREMDAMWALRKVLDRRRESIGTMHVRATSPKDAVQLGTLIR